jgi:uncharacterized membrane protein
MKMESHQIVMAVIYIIAGINHFRSPRMYLKIIPNAFTNKDFINKASGFLEILFGTMLLFSATSKIGAYGIIGLLIAFFATHFYMFQNKSASMGLPKWLLLVRILLQFGLIYWAFQYTKS